MKKTKSKLTGEYFTAGEDWFYERYETAQVQSNRWFIAFIVAGVLAISLAIAVATLVPLKTLIPLVVHQNTVTGEVWVDKPKTRYTPANDAQIQSDVVRYITARESYSPADINQRFHIAMLLSASDVRSQYAAEQSNGNKAAPINVLGSDGTRTVHIEDIVFIDQAGVQELRHFKKAAQNLAKVDFTTTTSTQGGKKTDAWVATIGWVYKGLPETQEDAWDNWNGFNVTTYRVDPRNL